MGVLMADVMGVTHRSEVVQTRRGYALVGLGLILPGAAQAIHGRRKLGRFALGVWIVLVLVAIVALILTLLMRHVMIGVFASGWVLKGLAICIFALALFWGLLAVNTWWISRPRQMGRTKGIVFSVITLVLAVALTTATVWLGTAAWATGGALSHIFGGGGSNTQNNGRYNILILGSDAGPDRWGTRPDSVTVVSVSASTGRAVIFGLPRNMESVPFPDSSPLHNLYPNGYYCKDDSCLLNAIYLLGLQNADLYPGVDDPGIQAMMEAATGITGLSINYFVMIDLQGFQDLIDAMGGLTMNINQRVALNAADNVYLEAGPNQHLNGYDVLWFARSRSMTSDYDRMQRQKCVMAAMLQQLNPATVASKFTDLAAATGETARTSVPPSQIGVLTDLALKTKTLPIISVSFTPPLIDPANPDYPALRATVADTIAQSQSLDKAGTNSAPTATQTVPAPSDPSALPTSTEQPADTTGYVSGGNVTDNLDQVCSVS